MKWWLSILILLPLMAPAKIGDSPWTGAPFSNVLLQFPYRYEVGAEYELLGRGLSQMVDFYDWDSLQVVYEAALPGFILRHDKLPDRKSTDPKEKVDEDGKIKRKFKDFSISEDYFTSHAVLEAFRARQPELARRLTDGLDLVQDLAARLHKPTVELPASKLILERTTPQLRQGILNAQGQLARSGPGIVRPETLIKPKTIQPLPARPLSFGWTALNNRWNQMLTLNERVKLIRLKDLSHFKRALILEELVRHNVPISSYLRADAPKYLRDLETSIDWLGDAIEYRHMKPMADVMRYLNELSAFGNAAKTFSHWKNPRAYSGSDSGFHTHLSIEPADRSESLEPIVRAWNHLILFKNIAGGVAEVFDHMIGYTEELYGRGAVRMFNDYHFETRDHFTDPETELAMLFELIRLPNDQAVEKVYREWMPALNQEQSRAVLLEVPETYAALLEIDSVVNRRLIETDIVQLRRWVVDSYIDKAARGETWPLNRFEQINLTLDDKKAIARAFTSGRIPREIEKEDIEFLMEHDSTNPKVLKLFAKSDDDMSWLIASRPREALEMAVKGRLKMDKYGVGAFLRANEDEMVGDRVQLGDFLARNWEALPYQVLEFLMKHNFRRIDILKQIEANEYYLDAPITAAYRSWMNADGSPEWAAAIHRQVGVLEVLVPQLLDNGRFELAAALMGYGEGFTGVTAKNMMAFDRNNYLKHKLQLQKYEARLREILESPHHASKDHFDLAKQWWGRSYEINFVGWYLQVQSGIHCDQVFWEKARLLPWTQVKLDRMVKTVNEFVKDQTMGHYVRSYREVAKWYLESIATENHLTLNAFDAQPQPAAPHFPPIKSRRGPGTCEDLF